MKQPNIVYVHSHDTGRYVQPYGHQVQTPNIQRLADQGLLLRQAFTAAPTCSGSRAALLTGQYPHVNGMTGLAHRGWKLNDYGRHIVHPLRAAGYWSALIGEQHLSDDPSVLGYDHVVDIGTTKVHSIAPAAQQLLRSRPPQPFFLSIGFFETHREFFEPSSVRDALYGMPPAHLPDTPETRADMAAFKASARSFDQGVGAILQTLDEQGFADDTLVVLTTDHGLPFPGAKGTLTDRGLGVLCILRGPGGFLGGHVSDALISQLDIYPTLCELAGAPSPGGLHGRSLLPLVRKEKSEIRDELFAELTYHAAYDPQRAIRTRRHKLIRHWGDRREPVLPNVDDSPSKDLLVAAGWGRQPRPEVELYDLLADPGEMRNLAETASFADVRDQLDTRLRQWMTATDDPLLDGPVPLPPGAFANDPAGSSAREPLISAAG
ncbi:sulfatase [Conexibacter stalactiti]|uniref:Sulfatase n=1 Tax=Conexibacter stalactiti TaxID=1940611 RepID=A0ABU4HLT3_9ACTN|nr:sulfatase [Conexibacter stalactiti]MDW5594265.1 sulfatase [Conexibacter stalactiti]MEC5034907.1 sulfatase [Conexibacter stalactiti]